MKSVNHGKARTVSSTKALRSALTGCGNNRWRYMLLCFSFVEYRWTSGSKSTPIVITKWYARGGRRIRIPCTVELLSTRAAASGQTATTQMQIYRYSITQFLSALSATTLIRYSNVAVCSVRSRPRRGTPTPHGHLSSRDRTSESKLVIIPCDQVVYDQRSRLAPWHTVSLISKPNSITKATLAKQSPYLIYSTLHGAR